MARYQDRGHRRANDQLHSDRYTHRREHAPQGRRLRDRVRVMEASHMLASADYYFGAAGYSESNGEGE